MTHQRVGQTVMPSIPPPSPELYTGSLGVLETDGCEQHLVCRCMLNRKQSMDAFHRRGQSRMTEQQIWKIGVGQVEINQSPTTAQLVHRLKKINYRSLLK